MEKISSGSSAIMLEGARRIGNECIHITDPEISLESYADRSNFKLYMGDTGLLVTQIMRNIDKTETDLYKALIFNRLGITYIPFYMAICL